MNVNGQRSRLPVPTLKTTTVTPAKLDKKKNNNKSNSLFSTTCSRMAQELKNYNNRKPANSNRRLSSISLSKMNKPPAKTLTIDKKKSTPLKNPTTTSKRKSPVTQLQEDLESLRQKNAEEKNLVKNQSEEIVKLKKLLEAKAEFNNARTPKTDNKLQIELGQQLFEKQKLKTKLDLITKQTEELQASAVDQLEVTAITGDTSLSNQISELQKQLKTREQNFKNQSIEYQSLLQQREHDIQKLRKTIDQQKADHANQIAQLNSIHMQAMDKLQTLHEHNMTDLKQNLTRNNPQQKKKDNSNVDAALEQVLLEFEQKQHNHVPPKPLVYQEQQHKLTMHRQINQQWYAQQYMPIDALSWPAPQPAPNLKRQLQTR